MPRIEKEVVRPGTYWYIDPVSQMPKKATFAAEAVKYFHDQGKAMLAAGLSIPVPVEHQMDARPMNAAERAAYNTRNNSGWVADYKLKKIKDEVTGQEVEALFSDLDIHDAEIANKLPKTIRWTSPWINSFVDGSGKAWNGVISHVALTTRPRIIAQQPFPSLDAAMSLAASLQDEPFTDQSLAGRAALAFGLSRAGLLKTSAGAKPVPAYPMAFALYSGLGFADDVPFEKKDKKKPDAPEGDEPPADPNAPPIEQALVDEDGDISIYEVLQDLLEAVGVPIDGANESNFFQKLYKAAMEKVKGAGGGTPAPGTEPGSATSGANTPAVTQEAPPLYMSLEAAQKITDPTLRSMALSLVQIQDDAKKTRERADTLEKSALREAGARRAARMQRLLKKMAPAAQQQLQALAKDATFSLQADGTVADSLDGYLALLETNTPDLPALLSTDGATVLIQPHPREYQGDMSEERRKEIVEGFCKAGGIRQKAAS